MTPFDLLGLKYRLGANPEKHGATDCIGLAVAVLTYYGIDTPTPKRDWYRRLRRGDTQVFEDELQRWGVKTSQIGIGTVALCRSSMGLGLAVFAEGGWIAFAESTVQWNPIGVLPVVDCYCQRKSISANTSE